MKVGDLVKHTSGTENWVWLGIITKEKSVLKTESCWPYKQYTLKKYHIEWTFCGKGWFWPEHLESV